MKKTRTRLFAFVLSLLFCLQGVVLIGFAEEGSTPPVEENNVSLDLPCKGAVLMEATTGKVLYAENPDASMAPASITKIMTLVLVMEALDAGVIRPEDMVTVSANASSMGGSQVFLKEGEQMTVEEMVKCVVIASANDAAVALAEHLCGSVPAFVNKMNEKAAKLGMKNTGFENVTGLDDSAQNHISSAMDVAIMSRELIKHNTILKYSSIWMDTIRNGEFGLTNTNRLVRYYQGCTGLKTGSTAKAGFCVSATATRGELSLICVIMGAESRDIRNAAATRLLDWGFANYGIYQRGASSLGTVPVVGGKMNECPVKADFFSCVLPKGEVAGISSKLELPQSISAPVKAGDEVGKLILMSGEKTVGEVSVIAAEDVARINFFDILGRMFTHFLLI